MGKEIKKRKDEDNKTDRDIKGNQTIEQWFKGKLELYESDPIFILEGIILDLEELVIEYKELQKNIEKKVKDAKKEKK